MWTHLERNIDGVIGRMLSWLTQPPVRGWAEDEAAESASNFAEEDPLGIAAAKTEVTTAAAESISMGSPEASETPNTTAESPAAAVERPDELSLTGVETAGEPEGGELADQLIAALAAAQEGLAMRQLMQQTERKPHRVRARLKTLISAGRVVRKGEGMRTRYHLAEA